jgi:hypothetical protein
MKEIAGGTGKEVTKTSSLCRLISMTRQATKDAGSISGLNVPSYQRAHRCCWLLTDLTRRGDGEERLIFDPEVEHSRSRFYH